MINVGILGATGAVGQRFVQLLHDHPQFQITALAASERSAGRTYREAANWIIDRPIPDSVAEMEVQPCTPDLVASAGCDVVFSGLDAAAADDLEPAFARAGAAVISNAKSYRMHPDVPLLIPEVNPDHTALIDRQEWLGADGEPSGGYIVTNPNCSTVGLVMALKPLYDAFGIEAAHVVTMQALSGAGYPGVSALDALGNVIPHIGGEEDKLATEPNKLLGRLADGAIESAGLTITAQCNRVPVLDGHMECASLRLKTAASPEDVAEAISTWRSPLREMGLPTAPECAIAVMDDERHPQPRRHAMLGRGMTVSVGRVQACPAMATDGRGVQFVVLSHNTLRGAAGGAVLNAELLLAQGRLLRKRERRAVASSAA